MLEQALTHASKGEMNNQTLEFLGDSILQCIISEHLFHLYPTAEEGELSIMRENLVNNNYLAQVGEQLGLADTIKSQAINESVIAATVEAIVAAIYLDSGWDNSRSWVIRHIVNEDALCKTRHSKSQLQEYLAQKGQPLPCYSKVKEWTKNNQLLFTIECHVTFYSKAFTTAGTDTRIKSAEAHAAKKMLKILNQNEQ